MIVLGKDAMRLVSGAEDCGKTVTDGTRTLVLSVVATP